MRAKHLLQVASFGVLTGLLGSPVLAQTGFGFADQALQPTNKAPGAAGKAIDEAVGQVTGKTMTQPNGSTAQSPAAKSGQTPMAQTPMTQTPMAKAEPAYGDFDSPPAARAGASDEFGQPAGEMSGQPKATLNQSPLARSDHMAKAEPAFEDAGSPPPPAKLGESDLPVHASAGMPAASSPTSRSATGQALGAAGQAIGGTAGQALGGLGQAWGTPQPSPGTTNVDPPSD